MTKQSKTRIFQNYEVVGGKHLGQNAIPKLRKKLEELGIDGFLIPHEDEWQNEYLPEAFDRLLYTTGFSGSAGAAIIMTDSAHMFVDGRYTLQVRVQTDNELFQYHDLVANGPAVFIKSQLPPNSKIGYDSRLLTPDSLQNLQNSASENDIILVEVENNPIDEIWENRPNRPMAPIVPHSNEIAGENSASKRAKIGETLSEQDIDCVVLTSPASLAWVFNIRGGDVIRSPLPLGSAILKSDGTASLFIDEKKISPQLKTHLGNGVTIYGENEFETALTSLSTSKVLIDNKLSSQRYFNILTKTGANIIEGDDPTILPRAMKNSSEIAGMLSAHIKDGVAMVKFLHWFDEHAPKGEVSEIDACKMVEHFRAQSSDLVDLSFDSISGAMGNAASPHYRVNVETNTKIENPSFFLLDSGGQYLDGTTDITRTISVGEVNEEMKDRYTRVLKGHIALENIIFPPNTPGCMLDTLARMALWAGGFDYDHGTGHGVGAYLGVHEGPQRIAKALANIPLRTGMVLSNEPGFYKANEYGIRIENLMYVTEAKIPDGGERPMHKFQSLTMCPIDTRPIIKSMMTNEEINWLNEYHETVAKTIGPLVKDDVRAWLFNACKAI